ncbi:MAG: RlmE family RNA methyltransferase [Betaproteobacteria bacterium]|nr:MAG: RlmE family RNA methyltransferase [Betaproteobacteria bacterium]
MTRRKPANQWMRRHVRDAYVKQAVRSGYRSRAAFKLIEIDQRDRLLRPGMVVVDLGASPGGWSQVASERVRPGGRVVAVDVLPMQPVPGVAFVHGDAREAAIQTTITGLLLGTAVDLVLCDMAPNITGVASVDEARTQALVSLSLEFAKRVLKPGGCLLVKVFHGCGLDAVIREMREAFAEVSIRKPSASRSQSSEVYVLCRGLLR